MNINQNSRLILEMQSICSVGSSRQITIDCRLLLKLQSTLLVFFKISI